MRSSEIEKQEKEKAIAELNVQIESMRNINSTMQMDLVKKEAALDYSQQKLTEQQEDVEKLQERFTKDFEILASKILEDKSSKFTEKNKENMEQILNPLQEKIKSFEKKVEDTHKESIEKQSALRQQILGLKELNEQMSKDAINLTRAVVGQLRIQRLLEQLVGTERLYH